MVYDNSKKILIVGMSGLLGSNWVNLAKPYYDVMGSLHSRRIFKSGIECLEFDFEDVNHITNELQKSGAQIVINCAGMTNVDECQNFPGQAFYINSVVPERLARSCYELRLKFVQISTDHIFSGRSPMSREDDPPSPLNVYASSKLLGERKVLEVYPSSLVIRTNFFGWGPAYRQSFSDRIINSLRLGQKVELFSDAFFTPLLMQLLVKDVHDLIELDQSGIYHVVGDDRVSKYDFGIKLAEVFDLDSSLIVTHSLKHRQDLTLRPLDLSLDNTKLRSAVAPRSRAIELQLRLLKAVEHEFTL